MLGNLHYGSSGRPYIISGFSCRLTLAVRSHNMLIWWPLASHSLNMRSPLQRQTRQRPLKEF